MRVDEIDLPDDAIEALKECGYVNLHPPQEKAIPIALEGRNLVVAVPTASGKSLIGYTAALKTILEKKRKVLYIVPLKALASEKKEDMDRFSHLGFRTAMSIGDLDSDDRLLKNADFIVATSEKADSLIRHGSRLIDEMGLVIADEIHLIHDPGRGPTLEVALTKIKRKNRDVQIIALSATISNANDLAMWLDADLVRMDWRPIPLYEGVCFEGEIVFGDGRTVNFDPGKDEIWAMIAQTVSEGGQCIVFVNSRRSTESLAVKYSPKMRAFAKREISNEEMSFIEGDADSTSMGRKLSECIKDGMAFHNAGLTSRQRHYVEENFRNGNIKCIVATPTLAAGINLPARRVIVRDTKRFDSNAGSVPIPVMEIKQMCGRAGRPGYDTYGEAVLIAKSATDRKNLMNNYIMCDTEMIMSKLGNETVLRNHILGLVSAGDVSTSEEIVDFIRDTFYGSESQLYGIDSAVDNVVDYLCENEMAECNEDIITPRPFGKRVSDLYIDPKSAVILKEALEKMDDETDDLPILHAVASTPDVTGLYPKVKDKEMLCHIASDYEDRFLIDTPEEGDCNYEFFMSDLKTAVLILDWINEDNEDTLTDTYGIGPGDIRSRIDMMDWLLYAMGEIAVLFKPESVKRLRKLLTRVRYGIREELSELVSLKGIGRTRARSLFDKGIKSRNDIRNIDTEELASVPRIGKSLASKLKEEVGNKSSEPVYEAPTSVDKDEENDAPEGPRQSSLLDFN